MIDYPQGLLKAREIIDSMTGLNKNVASELYWAASVAHRPKSEPSFKVPGHGMAFRKKWTDCYWGLDPDGEALLLEHDAGFDSQGRQLGEKSKEYSIYLKDRQAKQIEIKDRGKK